MLTEDKRLKAVSLTNQPNSVKVVQIVHGKFHHFDLARQLHKRGLLKAIFTGYPRWKLRGDGLPQEKVHTFPWISTFLMAKWRWGIVNSWLDRELSWIAAEMLDQYAARTIRECDVLVALSGAGLRTSRGVKSRGGSFICDRGSAHIRFVEKLLVEEYVRWGQTFSGIDSRSVAKEECEYETADVITVPSKFCLRSFVEMGVPARKLRRIPYGVDLTRFHKVADAPDDSFQVLFVGAVSFQKGVPYLLEAFRGLRHPRKRLRIVGAMQPEMERFLKDNPTVDVDFVGHVSQPELIPIMSSSHVMVLPSVQDGLGLVLGQAMACGCPIIASSNCGGEDLLNGSQGGLVIPARDHNVLRSCLEMLCQDRDLQKRMSEAALARVKELGGWEDYGNQYAAICHELHYN